MSGLIGLCDSGPISASRFGQAAGLIARHPDERSAGGRSRGARLALSALPASRSDLHASEGVVAAVYGRATWARTAAAPVADAVLADALAEAYLQHGVAMLDDLCGAFALAVIIDRPDRRETLIATDRLGIEAMYLHADGGALAFGTRADAVAALGGAEEIDAQAVYDYLYFHMVPGPRTAFAGVRRLLPGTCAIWKSGRLDIRNYWTPRFIEDERRPFEELKPAFWHALQIGVAHAAEFGLPGAPSGKTGCFLSGGTDSSTVCGVFGQVTGTAPQSFSIGFDASGYDEMAFARVAAQRFAAEHREYYVTPDDVADAVERIAAACDQPFGNASVVPAYYCAMQARNQGIVRMLAGDGGDELYGGNSRYAEQALFSYYHRAPAWLRRGLIEPLLALLPAAGVLRKAKGYVRQANVPLPARLQTYNLLERIGVTQVLDGDFLAGIERSEPLRLMEETYHGAIAETQINRLLAYDLRFTLADSDLPKVNRACELAGVDVAYPLLDPAVVAFSLRLPPDYKLRGRRLRWFFKEALRDFLPREVIEKKKHGFGLPFGVWLRQHPRLHELAADTLAGLRRRHIVRETLIDELMSSRLGEHAGYYGTLVWVLMTLEMWLARPKATGGGYQPSPSLRHPERQAVR